VTNLVYFDPLLHSAVLELRILVSAKTNAIASHTNMVATGLAVTTTPPIEGDIVNVTELVGGEKGGGTGGQPTKSGVANVTQNATLARNVITVTGNAISTITDP
jgi:hypothetical protein